MELRWISKPKQVTSRIVYLIELTVQRSIQLKVPAMEIKTHKKLIPTSWIVLGKEN